MGRRGLSIARPFLMKTRVESERLRPFCATSRAPGPRQTLLLPSPRYTRGEEGRSKRPLAPEDRGEGESDWALSGPNDAPGVVVFGRPSQYNPLGHIGLPGRGWQS